jgi:predicted dinucleotide-binding enzyme
MVSNSRGPDTLFSLTGSTGCQAETAAKAAAFGNLVVIAIPLKACQSIPDAELVGKIVLDANNYYPDRGGHITELDRGRLTSSELLAQHLSRSRIVKAFKAIVAADIEKDGRPAAPASMRLAFPDPCGSCWDLSTALERSHVVPRHDRAIGHERPHAARHRGEPR